MQVSHYYFLARGWREVLYLFLVPRVTGSCCSAAVSQSLAFATLGWHCLICTGILPLTDREHVQQNLSILRRECSRLLCPSVRPSVMMLWSNKSIGVIYCQQQPVNPSRGYPRNPDIRRIYKFRPKEHNRRRELGDRFPPLSPHRPDVHESRLRHPPHPPHHNLGGLLSSFDYHHYHHYFYYINHYYHYFHNHYFLTMKNILITNFTIIVIIIIIFINILVIIVSLLLSFSKSLFSHNQKYSEN